jgi:mono/diheme cytochrome c family protein
MLTLSQPGQRVAVLAAITAAVCSAASALAQPTDQRLVAQGRTLLAEKCGRCHQIGASGSSPLAAAPPFRTVMQKYKPEALEGALGEGLATGHPAMPEFTFEPDEIAAILAYLGTLREKR